jgi:hypothetical protein
MQACAGTGAACISTILNLTTWWKQVGSFTRQKLYHRGKRLKAGVDVLRKRKYIALSGNRTAVPW